ncbi:MAG: energy transducer TonB [Bryobacterales bacterium]|nr:energy transducer TonB [Bryobacterales bacterium]
MFEQSLLLNQRANKPWNFLASLSAQLIVVSLAILIPLAYTGHLEVFRSQGMIVGPPTLAAPVQPPATHTSGASNAPSPHHRMFYLDPSASLHAPQPTSGEFISDAPPTLGLTMPGGSTNMLGRFIPNIIATLPPPPKPPAEARQPPSAPIPVGGDVQMAKLVRKVLPEYPQIARAARISGTVRLIGTIAKDGTIRNLEIVSGHPMLARAAMQAVEQWVYRPTLLNGKPVEVIAPIEVSFTLGASGER